MRTEKEMLDLILSVAEKDERIRAVMMNGSRVNSNVNKDQFQDYDIVFYVKGLASFTADHSWVDVFGERIIMQMPDGMALFPSEWPGYAYLMLFADKNRIDLTLLEVEEIMKEDKFDSLSVILLDKDQSFPKLPEPTDADYITRKPTAEEFANCQNEFWWVSTYVVKALLRSELPNAKAEIEGPVRKMLVLMLSWHAGSQHNFTINLGKHGRWLERFLDEDTWEKFIATFRSGTYQEIWESLFAMCTLFEEISAAVADNLGYQVSDEGEKVQKYLMERYENR